MIGTFEPRSTSIFILGLALCLNEADSARDNFVPTAPPYPRPVPKLGFFCWPTSLVETDFRILKEWTLTSLPPAILLVLPEYSPKTKYLDFSSVPNFVPLSFIYFSREDFGLAR